MLKMYSYQHRTAQYKRMINIAILSVVWIAGLLTGAALANNISYQLVGYKLILDRISLLGLLFSTVLPLAISAVAIIIQAPCLIFPVAFIKGLMHAYSTLVIYSVYGAAGWLAKWLFVFSDSILILFLLWFWLRMIAGKCTSFTRDLLICSIATVVVVCIDFLIVSPFSVMLFNYS